MPWPEEALVAVSHGLVAEFPMDCPGDVKSLLMTHMGVVHRMVTEVREDNTEKGCFTVVAPVENIRLERSKEEIAFPHVCWPAPESFSRHAIHRIAREEHSREENKLALKSLRVKSTFSDLVCTLLRPTPYPFSEA